MKTIQTINSEASESESSEHKGCCGAPHTHRQATKMSTETKQPAPLKVAAAAVVFCIVADQLSKLWAVNNLVHNVSESFIPGLLKFTLTTNPGAAFSLGHNNGAFMGTVAGVLTLALAFWVYKRSKTSPPPNTVEAMGMGCVLGGAIGNLIDRAVQGQVTDFIEFAFMDFPIFNVADALIDVGIGLVFIGMFILSQSKTGEAEPREAAQ